MDSAKRVISGTWGEVWLDSDKVSECYGLQAKVGFNKEDIALCGQMASDKKVTSIECTGSLRMHKVTSRMALAHRGEHPERKGRALYHREQAEGPGRLRGGAGGPEQRQLRRPHPGRLGGQERGQGGVPLHLYRL